MNADDREALAAPFSPRGQAAVAAISNVLDVLGGLNRVWAGNLASYLTSSEPFAAFTDKLRQNGKQLARLFPAGSPGRAAVTPWLGLS